MMKKLLFFVTVLCITNCTSQIQTAFSEVALQNKITSIQGDSLTLESVLKMHKGKKILIDVWASWCADCIRGLPTIKRLQQEYSSVVFLFLSVDKNKNAWINGIKNFNIKGNHYLIENGFDSDLGLFLDLNWIPRYLVVDELGKISLFNATKATDKNIEIALKK